MAGKYKHAIYIEMKFDRFFDIGKMLLPFTKQMIWNVSETEARICQLSEDSITLMDARLSPQFFEQYSFRSPYNCLELTFPEEIFVPPDVDNKSNVVITASTHSTDRFKIRFKQKKNLPEFCYLVRCNFLEETTRLEIRNHFVNKPHYAMNIPIKFMNDILGEAFGQNRYGLCISASGETVTFASPNGVPYGMVSHSGNNNVTVGEYNNPSLIVQFFALSTIRNILDTFILLKERNFLLTMADNSAGCFEITQGKNGLNVLIYAAPCVEEDVMQSQRPARKKRKILFGKPKRRILKK